MNKKGYKSAPVSKDSKSGSGKKPQPVRLSPIPSALDESYYLERIVDIISSKFRVDAAPVTRLINGKEYKCFFIVGAITCGACISGVPFIRGSIALPPLEGFMFPPSFDIVFALNWMQVFRLCEIDFEENTLIFFNGSDRNLINLKTI